MEETIMIQTQDFQLTHVDFFIRMLVAVGIGFLLGLEREHSSQIKKEEIFAGVRTFVFVVIFGFLSAFLGVYFSIWIGVLGFLATLILVAISYWVTSNKGEIGSTTEFATLIAFLLGCCSFLGFVEASLTVTVMVLVVLSIKTPLKNIIGQITQVEMFALIKFVVLALLIFPFLPDETFGYYDVFNPRELGWVILLTSGVGFIGHLMIKFLGDRRGILFTGIAGGLVSSTVVTWVFSKKSKQSPDLSKDCSVAILVASTLMVIRVFVWISIFNPALLPQLIIPMLSILVAGFGVSVYYHKINREHSGLGKALSPGEPLDLKSAFFFGLLYTVILFVVSYANGQFGTMGIFISSAIASLTDIDAITISVAKLAQASMDLSTAQNAILLAMLCNTLVKIGISVWAGSKQLRGYVLRGYGLIFLAGLIGFLVLNFLP